MKQIKVVMGLLILVAVAGCTAGSGGAGSDGHGYWVNSGGGMVWKSGFGLCWGSSNSKPDMLGENCGAQMMAAPEPEISGNYLISDGDNDGVRDEYDSCPFTPEGVAVEENGCARDGDGDGIPDYLDQCPETPLGQPVDLTGCSPLIATLRGVHFAFDSASLTSEAKSILDQAAGVMKSHPSSSFTIEGHTDSTGPDTYNSDLSQRRAESVANYLSSMGVSTSMRAVGKGESSPVASNDTSSGRAKNRRVEVFAK